MKPLSFLPKFSVCLALVAMLISLPAFAQTPNKKLHVVLISLDGFPAFMWHDPSLLVPNLRKLAAEGSSAKALTVSNPSITWINHTTMVTGVNPQRHGVLFNGLLTRQGDGKPPKVEPWVDKDKLVFWPTLYDAAHQAGLTTAECDWVAVTRAKTINWSFAEIPDPNGIVAKEMLADGVITPQQLAFTQPGQRKGILFQDQLWTAAACHIFKKHQPNLLLYHTLNTDSTHHAYGAGTTASYGALAMADRLVGDLIKAVDDSGQRKNTAFIVTTDHGFKKVQKVVLPNVALQKDGLLRAEGGKVTACDAYTMSQGGMAFVYITNPARHAELLPKLKELFAQTEGVDKVLDGNEGPSLGMPTPGTNPGMGDLILFAKTGYAFKNDLGDAIIAPPGNYLGTHGYPASDPDMDGIFIASGAGIKKGVPLDRVSNLDIAPTLAKLMGLTLPQCDGRVLEEILR